MSRLFYKIGVALYFLAINIASLWNSKARKWTSGRKDLFEKLKSQIPEKKSKRYWFHCASLGEFEQARPLIEHLKEKNDCSIIISFFSPSGYNIRKNYELADVVTYLPIDSNKNAKKFIDIIQPDEVIFIKYEFWASFIFEIKRRNIPLKGISVIFRPSQPYFKWYGSYFRKILKAFDCLYLQNEESASLLNAYGLSNHKVTGDTRYNRVIKIAEQSQINKKIESFKGDQKLWILGSVWEEDMKIIGPFINEQLESDFKILLAPHHIEDANIKVLTSFFDQNDMVRYTQYNPRDKEKKIMILDTMGELASAYKHGDIAYVGGGFKTGLHNTLEPAAHGLLVIFGPKYEKFDEAKALLKNGFAYSVNTKNDLSKISFNSSKEKMLQTKKYLSSKSVKLSLF